MPGCVQNKVNTCFFVRFIVLEKFDFYVSRGRLWASFWELFGDTEVFFTVSEGAGKTMEFRRICKDFQRNPKPISGKAGW